MGLRNRSTTGVAFSGGASRGFTHIGVIMALEKFGIKPDVIAGVSSGSIAAVLYSSGMSPLDIRQCFADANKFGDFREWTVPKNGIFKLTKFAKLLDSWLSVKDLEELAIPTVVCASNLETGSQVGWCKGEIVPRVIASCSIPIVFTPVLIKGNHYVDGGVLHNLPAWAIREYCDVLYGCNCSPLVKKFKYRDSLLEIALRSYHLTTKANLAQDIRLCDYVITPPALPGQKMFDLASLDRSIRLGYEAACRVLESAATG